MLEIKNLTVGGSGPCPVFENVSLCVRKGECLGLTGASGSGKTTLIKTVLGMQGPGLDVRAGGILLDGEDLLGKPMRERRRLLGRVFGFIPQNPMTAFFPHARIGSQMTETLRLHTAEDRREARLLAGRVLRQVNLKETERILNAYPHELSGGMLQRVSMALILGMMPQYILADEPTSALDEGNRDLLLELLAAYRVHGGILFISHDIAAMKKMCPQTYVMEYGTAMETQRFGEAVPARQEVEWEWTELN